MIDRIHWKVGDWVHPGHKGRHQIISMDDKGVKCLVNVQAATGQGDLRHFSYENVKFVGVSESKDWTRGSVVYLDGIHKQVIEYIRHHPNGCVDYIEWNGDWDSAYGDRLTHVPLDPALVIKSKKRDLRLEYEVFQGALAAVMSTAPRGASRWASDVMEMFDTEFDEQLQGEQDV